MHGQLTQFQVLTPYVIHKTQILVSYILLN